MSHHILDILVIVVLVSTFMLLVFDYVWRLFRFSMHYVGPLVLLLWIAVLWLSVSAIP